MYDTLLSSSTGASVAKALLGPHLRCVSSAHTMESGTFLYTYSVLMNEPPVPGKHLCPLPSEQHHVV